MQGLALATGRPMVGVSTLDAGKGAEKKVPGTLFNRPCEKGSRNLFLGAWVDAQRGEVFTALYRGGELVDGPAAETPGVALARWASLVAAGDVVFVGDGALTYASAIADAFPRASIVPEVPPLAPAIAQIAAEAAARHDTLAPDAIRPLWYPPPGRGADPRPPRRRDRNLMTWTIERTLSEADMDEIVAIEAAAFSNPWTRLMYLRELQNPDVSFLYVLRMDNRIAGFCSFWLVLDEIHINNLAIRHEYQGQGLGTALLKEVLQAGANRGAERATLEVRRSNAPARRLYEPWVSRWPRRRPNYYVSPPEDALILWKGGLNCVTFRP